MEVKSKELRNASYRITCENGDYTISGNVTIGTNNVITNMDNCNIAIGANTVANFSYYGTTLNINFVDSVPLAEQTEILTMIEAFKTNITM